MGIFEDTIFISDCDELDSYHTKYINNPDDAIGNIIPISVCESKDEDGKAKKILPSDEYVVEDYFKRPRCANCDGTTVHIKRVGYKADPEECCQRNGVSKNTNLTCHPDYRDGMSQSCIPKMQTFCNRDANMLFHGSCLTWCQQYPGKCYAKKSALCNSVDRITNYPKCKQFCIENPGLCDTGMRQYCKLSDNISKPECSCINSYLDYYRYNPLCQDAECIRDGYGTASMLNSLGEGCKIVDCSVVFDIEKTGNVSFKDTTISQRCGKEALNEDDQESSIDDTYSTYSPERLIDARPQFNSPPLPKKSNLLLYVIVGITVLCVVMGIAASVYLYYK
jgi:hypothetical protein